MLKLKKILHTGISVYIIALLTIPCNDVCQGNSNKHEAILRRALVNHGMESDLCTPFCTCSCCTSPFMNVEQLQISLYTWSAPYYINYSSTSSEYLLKIWLPPKVS